MQGALDVCQRSDLLRTWCGRCARGPSLATLNSKTHSIFMTGQLLGTLCDKTIIKSVHTWPAAPLPPSAIRLRESHSIEAAASLMFPPDGAI